MFIALLNIEITLDAETVGVGAATVGSVGDTTVDL
jgi:hypothetical protein